MIEELNVFVDAHPTLEDEDQQMLNPSRIGVCSKCGEVWEAWGSVGSVGRLRVGLFMVGCAWEDEDQQMLSPSRIGVCVGKCGKCGVCASVGFII